MKDRKSRLNEKERASYKPIIGITIISLLMCGLSFPLLITGLAQVLLSNQANGQIVQLNGRSVGSTLIAQNFTLPIFFHPRNDSASGVDPHITLQDAYAQISRIHNATGIPSSALEEIVNQNTEGVLLIFGSPYVNVLRVNLMLIKTFPSAYKDSV
ncbi:MAG: potassium-transporting ATPase subunit C [Thaumarchaeota archaeon]|nr:potassium-transporting ATPase subunit C [Nitrososphaerota archaeon]